MEAKYVHDDKADQYLNLLMSQIHIELGFSSAKRLQSTNKISTGSQGSQRSLRTHIKGMNN